MRSEKRRFWEKVEVSSSVGCWYWAGHKHKAGHGQFYFRGRAHYAHRVAWRLTFGRLQGKFVLHRCDNPNCVNPFHLFLGTQADNVADMIAKGRMAYGEKRARKGEKHGMAELTNKDVKYLRKAHAQNSKTVKELSAQFGVTKACIYDCLKRKTWRHI